MDGTWTYTYDGTGATDTRGASLPPIRACRARTWCTATTRSGTGRARSSTASTTTYSANNLNQYTSVGGVAQTYDADGNLLSDGTNTYTYDVLDRLISVTSAAGTTTYTYDALGNRSSSTTGGQVTKYLIDPSGLSTTVGEFDGTGNLDRPQRLTAWGW